MYNELGTSYLAEIILQSSFSNFSTLYDSNPHPATIRQYLKLLLFKTSRTIDTTSSLTGFPMINKHLRSLGLQLCSHVKKTHSIKPFCNLLFVNQNRKPNHLERRQLLDTLGTRSIKEYAAAVPMQRFSGVIVQEYRCFSGVLAHFTPRPIGNHGKRSVHVKRHWILFPHN